MKFRKFSELNTIEFVISAVLIVFGILLILIPLIILLGGFILGEYQSLYESLRAIFVGIILIILNLLILVRK